MKIKIWILVFVLSLFTSVNYTLADESSPSAEFNPNAVFWPLSAGKTVDDNLFFLKELKENIRGMIIFGSMQKSNYQITLVTKRLMEADKLLEQKKVEAGLKTLDKADKQISSVLENIEKTSKDKISPKIKLKIIDQVQKLREYGKIIRNKGDGRVTQKLDDIDKKEETILNILY